MTFAQSIGVIGMTVFKLTPQMNGIILSYNGILGLVSASILILLILYAIDILEFPTNSQLRQWYSLLFFFYRLSALF